MLNLNGVVDVETLKEVIDYTKLRLRDSGAYQTSEAVALYEQRIIPVEEIHKLCEEAVGMKLYTPTESYVPDSIVMYFQNTGLVPVSYIPSRRVVTCVSIPEIGGQYLPSKEFQVNVVYTPLYNYFKEYVKQFGMHPELLPIPAKNLIDSIVKEALSLGAADITISTVGHSAQVYYNVRKAKVYSRRIIAADAMYEIIKLLCIQSPMDNTTNKPKYVGVDLNTEYRGRVVINKKFKGYAITIRLLPNATFEQTLEACNLKPYTIDFMRDTFMNRELGLRLLVGATMSGKNTTALACLHELVIEDTDKVVSIEMPVEQELEGVEQINCNDEKEYDENIVSLIRQNPDFVYITEIGDTTAGSVMRVVNTGKRVISTLHANSCSDTISRLLDITHLPVDRIIQPLHSIVYQQLIRDEERDMLRPVNRYIYLSQERKNQLYGREYGEVIKLMQQWESGDVW